MCDRMIDNLFAHQEHFKADSSDMPLSDFCLISSSSHNPNQNDSGCVLQGNWGMGMHCTTRAAPVFYLTDQLFPSSQDVFKKVESGPISAGVIYVCKKLRYMLNKQCD